jgi:acylphosphatase
MPERAVHVIVTGLVQGVGFRAFVQREAMARGVSGWVQNRRDGSVEAVFSGEAAAVDGLVAACRRGPRMASARAMKVTDHAHRVAVGFVALPTV